jgi:hypothetical protein
VWDQWGIVVEAASAASLLFQILSANFKKKQKNIR